MNVRRPKALWLALACCAGVSVVGFFLIQPSQHDLRLILVGYTNELVEAGPNHTIWMTKAILEVTNCGPSAVALASLWQAYAGHPIPVEHAGSYLILPTTLQLKPGETKSVITYLPSLESDGRLKVAYTRLGWIESLAIEARNSRHTTVRKLANKLLPTEKRRWARSGLISNPPPTATSRAISRYNITAPPPEIPIELLPRPKPQ